MCPPAITSMFQIAKNENYDLRSNNKTVMLSKPKPNVMSVGLEQSSQRDSCTTKLKFQFYCKRISLLFWE